METDIRPVVQLVGEDGNAFSILGRCKRAAQRAGWTSDQVSDFIEEATNGDYNHLLSTVMTYFDEPEPDDFDEPYDTW